MSTSGENRTISPLGGEHNVTEYSTSSKGIARAALNFVSERRNRFVAATVMAPLAAIGLSACGADKGASANEKHEALYASSCASEYKKDSNARVYKLAQSGTFESQVDGGVILDSDNKTPVTGFTDTQRAEMIIGFNKMDEQYKPVLAPSVSKVNLAKLRLVVYNDSTEASSASASDGNLDGDVCLMFGSEESWDNIRKGNSKPYTDGDIDPIALRN